MGAVRTNSVQAWTLAARPKTLTGALIPVILATALAVRDGVVQWPQAVLCALFAATMQVAANFVNDYFDYKKGADREDRLGPERACAQGWITPRAMRAGIVVAFGVACLGFGLSLVALSYERLPWHGLELVALGVVCVGAAIAYTRWCSYWGLGDLLVVVFFGFVPVGGTYYVQAFTLTWAVGVLSLISGLAIDALLVVNNYRDREQDRISGKRTLIVRLGEPFGRWLYLATGLAVEGLTLALVPMGYLTWVEVAEVSIYLLLHVLTWRKLCRIREGRALNALLGETSRNMFLLSLLLAAALCGA